MPTRILSTTSKPAEPTSILNGMLPAKEQGLVHGPAYGLQFAPPTALDAGTIHLTPTGFSNPAYNVVSQLDELDPTSLLALSRSSAEFKTPSGTVGYTHLHTEHSYRLGISAQFAKWYVEFCTLYELALQAETSRKSGRVNLSDQTSVSEGDGHIEAFLMAVGDITGREYGYGRHDQVDVQAIYTQTVTMISPYVASLDHYGFDLGLNLAKTATGIGSLPVAQESIAFLPAASVDGLFRAPYRIAMRNPRAREMMREALISRIPAEVCGEVSGNLDTTGGFWLSEGDDLLLIPTWLAETPSGVFDAMAAALDGLAPLSDETYIDPTNADWTDQFRTQGEVVRAIFVDETLTFDPGYHNVFSVNQWIPEIMPNGDFRMCPQGPVTGTGPLHSLNRMELHPSMYNHISGSTDWGTINGSTLELTFTGTSAAGNPVQVDAKGTTGIALPSGILYLGICANATAIDWFKLLRWLDSAWSPELREISRMTKHDRNTLPNASISRVKDSVSMLADIVSASQRNGIATPVFATFNVKRPLRDGQQGPALLTNGTDFTQQLLTSAGEWDLNDHSELISWTNTLGRDINLTAHLAAWSGIPGRFTGNMDADRAPASWVAPGLPDSNAAGSKDVEMQVATNLMSWPLELDGLTAMSCGHELHDIRTGHGGASAGPNSASIINLATEIGNAGRSRHGVLMNSHPTYGFMRGYYSATSTSPWSSAGLTAPLFGGWARVDGSTGFNADGTTASPALTGTIGATVGRAAFAYGNAEYCKTLTTIDPTLNDAQPRCGYMWDPLRSQIVGTGWYNWAGVLYTDVTMSPYQQGLITVATGAIKASDLNIPNQPFGMDMTSAELIARTQSVPSSITLNQHRTADGLVLHEIDDAADNDNRVETALGCAGTLYPVNGLKSQPSVMSWDAASVHNTEFGGLHITGGSIYGNVAGAGVATDVTHLPIYVRSFSVRNDCGRNKTQALTAVSLDNNDGTYFGGLRFTTNAPRAKCVYQSEQVIAPADANIQGNLSGRGVFLTVSGEGQVPEHDLVKDALSPYAWLMRTFLNVSDLPSASELPLGEYLADGILGLNPIPVTAHLPSQTTVNTANSYALSNVGSVYSSTAWFELDAAGRYDGVLSRRRSKIRKDLNTPWERTDSKAGGIVHLRFDSKLVASKMSTEMLPKIYKLGTTLVTGMDNDIFRKIQIRN